MSFTNTRLILIATIFILSTTQPSAALKKDMYPYKRVPQGFFGMRGKKDLDFLTIPSRRMQGFIGVKGKKDDPSNFAGDFIKPNGIFEFEKKDVGTLVGKVDYSIEEKGPQDDSVLPFLQNIYSMLDDNSHDRSDNEISDYDASQAVLSKRAASKFHTFYGMRGKKSPRIFRGKKGPYDFSFRGKFVGVRGKKSDDGIATWDDGESQQMHEDQSSDGYPGFLSSD